MRIRTWLVVILLTYAASLALPAIGGPGHGETWGIECLLSVFGIVYPAWWANPVFFAGCVCLGRGKFPAAFLLGLVAMGLAMSFGLMMGPNLKPHVGYLVWIASMTGLTFAAAGHLGRLDHTPAGVAARETRDVAWLDEPIHDPSPDPGSSSDSPSSAPLSSRSPS